MVEQPLQQRVDAGPGPGYLEPFLRSIEDNTAAICWTTSSAKTRRPPARRVGAIWRERMTYSMRWTGWPRRRAISPTVGSCSEGGGIADSPEGTVVACLTRH